jgi:hypothetical protein
LALKQSASALTDLNRAIELQPTMAMAYNNCGVSQVFSKTDALPSCDFYCPMMSLPLAFGTTLDNIPSTARYLSADTARIKKWTNKLGVQTKPRAGVVWSSDEQHPNSISRSVPLDAFARVMSDDYEFVILQRAIWPRDLPALEVSQMRCFDSELIDFLKPQRCVS